MTPITRKEFTKATQGHSCGQAVHDYYGTAIYWNIGGRIYIEYCPHYGNHKWSVSE